MQEYIRLSDKFTIGKAGEHLACYDLLKKGFLVSMAAETLPYDLLLDNGKKIIKVQVKTTETSKIVNQWRGLNKAYTFSIKRKGYHGCKRYKDNDVDLFVLVCLDTMQIGYIKNCDMPTTINIRDDRLRGKYHDEKGLNNFNIVKKLKTKGLKCNDIIKETGLKETSIRNYMKDDFIPFRTKSLYMSDLQKNAKWFKEL